MTRSEQGEKAVAETPRSSIFALHKRWAKLENERHQLALDIDAGRTAEADLAPMRERENSLLLEIGTLVAEISDAPAMKAEDLVALLDVALEHELDLASDIALYGPSDYPMITRLLRELAHRVPGFEFNSLRRWLSPDQFELLMRDARLVQDVGNAAENIEPIGFGSRRD